MEKDINNIVNTHTSPHHTPVKPMTDNVMVYYSKTININNN